MKHFYTIESSSMYNNMKMFMISKKLRLYGGKKEKKAFADDVAPHPLMIQELLELQATASGKGAYSVEALHSPGKHDDVSDSLARGVLIASKFLSSNPGLMDIKSKDSRQRGPMVTYKSYHRNKEMMHGKRKYH